VTDSEKDKSPETARASLCVTHVLVHYDEIALKGGNRRFFENRLAKGIRTALKGLGTGENGQCRVQPKHGRFLVKLGRGDTKGPDGTDPEGAPIEEVCRRLETVFGVARFSPCVRIDPTLENAAARLEELVDDMVARGISPESFAIVTHRARKDLPFQSLDANKHLGSVVHTRTGWPVKLKNPDLPIHVWFVDKDAFIAVERVAGPGGLPAGSTGRVVCLLSGGIDSPVSSYRIMKRGTSPIFVHFHSAPHTSTESQEKVRELAIKILHHGQRARLYMIPFAATQQRIITECPAPLRVVLYRRYMIRAAEAIALRDGAQALVTGDSLGQVASQTLENIDTIARVATLPILRPLVGMHKAEIVDDARAIGTYETSIEPHDDCCSFLMPPNPATRSTPEQLEEAEEALDTEAEIAELLEKAEVETIVGGQSLDDSFE